MKSLYTLLCFDIIRLCCYCLVARFVNVDTRERVGRTLVNFFLRLGPAGIKIGQVLSHRTDIFPLQVCDILSELTNNVPGLTPDDEVRLLKQAQQIVGFTEQPRRLGSGCVSATYLANIGQTDSRVVMKIKRPHIDDDIQRSFSYVYQLFWLLTKLHLVEFNDKLDKVKESLMKQTDFVKELEELCRFHEIYKNSANIRIPAPYTSLSNENIITQEYLHGGMITDLKTLEQVEHVARSLWDFSFQSAFIEGCWHADLHKGNVICMMESDMDPTPKLGIIDFGITGSFKGFEKSIVLNYNTHILKKEWERAGRLFVTKMVKKTNMHAQDRERFMREVSNILSEHYGHESPDIMGSVCALTKCSKKYGTKFNNQYAKFEMGFSTLACTMVELGYPNIYDFMKTTI